MNYTADKNKRKSMGRWIAFGVAIGCAIGVAIGNLALGLGPGIASGAAIYFVTSTTRR
ncbi:hypothetical protein [Duganella sp. Leaf126]|uniref:hypothetical protein n=1 Tax=Duganella sp. Leaf126 TaxID=1736266 RepID=UPI0019108313|nr:hypothetical protein [Duganella sp. Leaf126]